jgi:hypothetical protein
VKIAAMRLEADIELGRECTFTPELVSSEAARERADKRRAAILAEAKERAEAVRKSVPDPEEKSRQELTKKHRPRAVPRVSTEIADFMEPFMQRPRRAQSVERRRR